LNALEIHNNYKYNDYECNYMKFYGRQDELSLLTMLHEKAPSFAVITGRRRIGKTELIKEFLKGKDGIYLYVDPHKNIDILIAEYTSYIREVLSLPQYISFPTPEAFLEFLFGIERPFIVVFDEFQRFLDIYPAFISQLQNMWDLKGKESHLFLIASGSSVGMIQKIFIDTKAPLFRRADSIITLKPFQASECFSILDDLCVNNREEKLRLYLLFGGIIYYYHILEKYGCHSFEEALDRVILSNLAPLSQEMSAMLIEEFGGGHTTYYEILGALADGRSTQKTIADLTHIAPSSLPPYLTELSDILGIIEYRVPVTEERFHSKMGRYLLKDPFIRFYCRYIYRNMTLYQLGRYDLLKQKILDEWNDFAGWQVEEMVRELLVPRLATDYERFGSWWNRRGDEIDLLAIGSAGSLAVEIKNRELSYEDTEIILKNLEVKTGMVKRLTYPVTLGIAARTVEGRDIFTNKGVKVFELNELI